LSLLKNPFGLRIGWQVKIATDDIDDPSRNCGGVSSNGFPHPAQIQSGSMLSWPVAVTTMSERALV
jgi:hypothetical protein